MHDDITELFDNLFQGGGYFLEQPSDIDVVINLRREIDPFIMEGRVRNLHAYVWLPLEDGYFPGVKWLDAVVDLVKGFLDLGYKTLVHCLVGVSRSTLVTAAYVMKIHGLGAEEAVAKIRRRRYEVCPNPNYKHGLAEYQSYLESRKTTQVLEQEVCDGHTGVHQGG